MNSKLTVANATGEGARDRFLSPNGVCFSAVFFVCRMEQSIKGTRQDSGARQQAMVMFSGDVL